MTLIDDYVRQVRFWLPGRCGRVAEQEVRATLEDLVAEREGRLGRPLADEEIAAELKAFGRPQVIASRYASARPLVSAALMPAYTRVLGICVVALLIVQLSLAFAAPVPGDVGATITTAVGRSVTGLLWTFASVTIAFAVLTRLFGPSAGSGGPEC